MFKFSPSPRKWHTPKTEIMKTKPITKQITLTLNGFHGYESHNVRANFSPISDDNRGGALEYQVEIADSAARKFVCTGDCTCGEGMPTSFLADGYDFEVGEITINGNYPQL